MTDIAAGPSFDETYRTVIEPQLKKLGSTRFMAMAIVVGVTVSGGGGLLFWLYHMSFGAPGDPFGRNLLGFGLLFVSLCILVFGFPPVGGLRRRVSTGALAALGPPFGLDYSSNCNEEDLEGFFAFKLLMDTGGWQLEDRFSGQRGEARFALFHYVMFNSRLAMSQGQVLRIATPQRAHTPAHTTLLVRRQGLLTLFSCPEPLIKVEIEDPVLRKEWNLYGTDDAKALKTLNPALIEQLLDLQTRISAKRLRCVFEGPNIYIVLENGKRLGGGLFTSPASRAGVEDIAGKLRQVFKAVDQIHAA